MKTQKVVQFNINLRKRTNYVMFTFMKKIVIRQFRYFVMPQNSFYER